MSRGPETDTCMSPESPGPNRMTSFTLPRFTAAPVFCAMSCNPSNCAFTAPLAPTVMSTPPAVWPAPTLTGFGAETDTPPPPPLGGGWLGGGLDGLGVVETPFPPQPDSSHAQSSRRTSLEEGRNVFTNL